MTEYINRYKTLKEHQRHYFFTDKGFCKYAEIPYLDITNDDDWKLLMLLTWHNATFFMNKKWLENTVKHYVTVRKAVLAYREREERLRNLIAPLQLKPVGLYYITDNACD